MFRKLQETKSDNGYTVVELITGIAILGVVAYLVLPLIFPSGSKSAEEYIEEDLSNIAEILKIRSLSAEANNIPIADIYIGNLGVFAAKSQVRHAISINPSDETLTYCLRGEYRGKTLYFESGSGVVATPTGLIDCPGVPSTANGSNGDTEEQAPATSGDEEPTEIIEDAPTDIVEEPATGETQPDNSETEPVVP